MVGIGHVLEEATMMALACVQAALLVFLVMLLAGAASLLGDAQRERRAAFLRGRRRVGR